MKRLYLMRHGQTLYNLQGLVQGRCDSPLTDKGVEQAKSAAEWIAREGVVFDRICSSPIGRALSTAHLVRGVLQERAAFDGAVPEVEAIDGLKERCYGVYEQGPQSEVPADVWDPGEALVPEGGEGSAALRERMVSTLTSLMEEPDVDCLLAVSHGSAVLQFKLAWERAARCDQAQPLGNCCILVFDYDESSHAFSNIEIVNQ